MKILRSVLFLCLAAAIPSLTYANTSSRCDVLNNGSLTIADAQWVIDEVLGVRAALDDLNGDGVINVVDVFYVINALLGKGCAADPGLVSILPNAGQQGVSGIAVTITGRNTSFTNSSSVSLGAGIAISNVAATSATVLTATLAIDPNTPTGPRNLTVDTLTLPDAFAVTPPLSISYTYDSQGRLTTATYVLPSGGVTTVTYSYDAAGNRTSVVAQ